MDDKGRLFELNFTVTDFTLATPTRIEGLNKELLYELFDIARKWGDLNMERMLHVPSLDQNGFGIATHVTQGGLFVAKRSPGHPGFIMTGRGTEILQTFSDLSIIWDGQVSAEEALRTIQRWNEFGASRGWCRESGERLYRQTASEEALFMLRPTRGIVLP